MHLEAFSKPSKCFVPLSPAPLHSGPCGTLRPLPCPPEVHMEQDPTNAPQTKINMKSVHLLQGKCCNSGFQKDFLSGHWDEASKNADRLCSPVGSHTEGTLNGCICRKEGGGKGGRQDEGREVEEGGI